MRMSTVVLGYCTPGISPLLVPPSPLPKTHPVTEQRARSPAVTDHSSSLEKPSWDPRIPLQPAHCRALGLHLQTHLFKIRGVSWRPQLEMA